jgi:hypothetical protein
MFYNNFFFSKFKLELKFNLRLLIRNGDIKEIKKKFRFKLLLPLLLLFLIQ